MLEIACSQHRHSPWTYPYQTNTFICMISMHVSIWISRSHVGSETTAGGRATTASELVSIIDHTGSLAIVKPIMRPLATE